MWHVLWCVWCTDCLWVVDPLPLAAPDLIPGSAYSPENAEAPHSASHRALQAATANPSPGVLRDHLNFMFPWNQCLWLFKNTTFGKESTLWCSSSASPAAGSQRAIRIGEWSLQTVCVLYICAMFGNKTVKPIAFILWRSSSLPRLCWTASLSSCMCRLSDAQRTQLSQTHAWVVFSEPWWFSMIDARFHLEALWSSLSCFPFFRNKTLLW